MFCRALKAIRISMTNDVTNKTPENSEINVIHFRDKATVMSSYRLSEEELSSIKKLFPELKNGEVINVVDSKILSGLIIKIGTKLIDLTLNGALQNLKKQIYESN